MKRYVLIVAGGKGLRMGSELPKQFIPVAGRPVLMHTLERFGQWDASASLILVLSDEYRSYWEMLCRELGCRVPHRLASGGETRFHSVRNGLELVDEAGLVGVHDGVRPLVAPEVISACFAGAERYGAAIPVLPLIDSIRETGAGGTSRPLDRNRYVTVQTPQVFRSELLREAYRQNYTPAFTDDASVVEAMGGEVRTLAGNRENIKITDAFDLQLAGALLHKTLSIHD
ncbi:MAG: 2-C-methyl-D-erythritol 4-phosphate cytidylyltransferase [Tannerellaceae bacterium]|jgi:2-C-methyl-D-erythritol 4-phosphate cytidylyltransferase|nr:2-C-methyl-D-erythritol 4-phosphate cytidylyltransferase [Tannerellaceae bacterium]